MPLNSQGGAKLWGTLTGRIGGYIWHDNSSWEIWSKRNQRKKSAGWCIVEAVGLEKPLGLSPHPNWHPSKENLFLKQQLEEQREGPRSEHHFEKWIIGTGDCLVVGERKGEGERSIYIFDVKSKDSGIRQTWVWILPSPLISSWTWEPDGSLLSPSVKCGCYQLPWYWEESMKWCRETHSMCVPGTQ